jgi:hypothetical protein
MTAALFLETIAMRSGLNKNHGREAAFIAFAPGEPARRLPLKRND